MKDYYKILGIPKTASQDEIKKAYRKAVLYWHPDKNKSPQAHDKIVELNEAYDVIGDPLKRRFYDLRQSEPQYTYRPYEPPPQQQYNPPPRYQKQDYPRQESQINWGRISYGVIMLFLILSRNFVCNSPRHNNSGDGNLEELLRNLPKNSYNSKDYNPYIHNYSKRNNANFSFSVDSIGDFIDISSYHPEEKRSIKRPALVFHGINRLFPDFMVSATLNGGTKDTFSFEEINTIVVFEYFIADTNVRKGEAYKHNAKVYFVNPETLNVFNEFVISKEALEKKPLEYYVKQKFKH